MEAALLDRERTRQIDAAWARHRPDPSRARVITPEARRAVRLFKQQIDGDADRVKAALRGCAPLILDWTKKGPRGRARKFPPIQESLSPAEVVCIDGELLVLWLRPFGPLLQSNDPSYRQDCVLVLGMVVSRQRGSLRWNGFPIFEAPDHMLGRMMQRAPAINAAAALYQGAQSFLSADRALIATQPRDTLYVPTGSGLTVGLPIRALSPDRKAYLIMRGSTWLSASMAGKDQRPIAEAADPSRSVLAALVPRAE